MSDGAKFADLRTRLISGGVMAAVGVAAIWAGGPWFSALAVIAAGLMIWELAAMLSPDGRDEAVGLGVLAGGAVALALWLGTPWAVAVFAIPAAIGAMRVARDKVVFAIYALAVLSAAYGLARFRVDYGMLWLLWLVVVVVVTDVAGYFAGRILGGPKFWPRISPKKTWSGTAAGWIGAALVGLAFLSFTTAGRDLPWISALVAFASQMGDIAESAIKRRAGVKDSSNLIPGHGGLLDRFDGLLGAALMMLVVAQVVVVPEIRG
ncbi:MAG: phosphatidate cytidylyltransferase [Paracoccaceae bacterium]